MELQELQGTLESAGHHVPIPTLESLREFAQSKCKRAAGVTLAGLCQTRYIESGGERERDKNAQLAMSKAAPSSPKRLRRKSDIPTRMPE
eukprot:6473515-Amphidinium_carterae.1